MDIIDLLKDKDFVKELKEAISSGKSIQYGFDGENDIAYEHFSESESYDSVIIVLEKFLKKVKK